MHERIFGPETPTGQCRHPASITEPDNGDLSLGYYSSAGEYATDTAVGGSRLSKGSREWTSPQVLARHPFRSAGNPAIWQAPVGIVWFST